MGRKTIKHETLVPPLYDKNGELIRDRYVISVKIPGEAEQRHTCASEWGMFGRVDDAVMKVGDNGRRQVYITLTVEPGEKTGTLGENPECADAEADLRTLARMITRMHKALSGFIRWS